MATFTELVDNVIADLGYATSETDGRVRRLLADELRRVGSMRANFAEEFASTAILADQTSFSVEANTKLVEYLAFTPTGSTRRWEMTMKDQHTFESHQELNQIGNGLPRMATFLANTVKFYPGNSSAGAMGYVRLIDSNLDDAGSAITAASSTHENVWTREAAALLGARVTYRYHLVHTRDKEAAGLVLEVVRDEEKRIRDDWMDRHSFGFQQVSNLPDGGPRTRDAYRESFFNANWSV